jgi:mannose-6-phosphate isomerase class I
LQRPLLPLKDVGHEFADYQDFGRKRWEYADRDENPKMAAGVTAALEVAQKLKRKWDEQDQ